MPFQVQNPQVAFGLLLNTLFKVQRSEWEKVPSQNRKTTKERIDTALARYLAAGNQLQFDQRIDLVQDRKLIPLPPLEKDAHLVPFLTISYDADGNDFEFSCCRIYVLLLGINGGKIHGIGFRIESPESNCKDDQQQNGSVGMHDFYHAQFFRDIRGWDVFYNTPPWLPDSQPSFPLWAIQPIDALLNLILTLYGAKYYLSFFRNHGSGFAHVISDEFKLLNIRLSNHP
jgi:hypothetical protein